MRFLIVALAVVSLSNSTLFAENPRSNYRVEVDIGRLPANNAVNIPVTVRYNISLAAGDDFVYLPLPFRENLETEVSVITSNARNFVACGRLRPEKNFGICVVSRQDLDSDLSVEFNGALMPMSAKSGESGDLYTIDLLFAQAYRQAKNNTAVTNIPELLSLDFQTKGFIDSVPSSVSRDGLVARNDGLTSRRIELISEDETTETAETTRTEKPNGHQNITIQITRNKEHKLFLLFWLGLGILLGLLTSPKITAVKLYTILGLLGSFISIILLAYYFFFMLPVESRFLDSTTVTTIGTLSGMFLSIFVSSLLTLFKGQ